jgi:uncharacterized protein YbaA (DUF1428 family)
MSYVDGFVIPVPKRKIGAYKKMARMGRKSWLEAGALEYFECAGDDLTSMPGAGDFRRLAKLRPGETVFFSFIVYRNKAPGHVAQGHAVRREAHGVRRFQGSRRRAKPLDRDHD